MLISRILVPTDFSHDADAALAYALELARPFNATVHLLHVVENPMAVGVRSSHIHRADVAGLQINLVRQAEQRLRRSLPRIAGVPTGVTREVRTGDPAEAIVDGACEAFANLIVMGTRGQTGVSHLVMGSVAERVVRAAPCPVLTIRAQGREPNQQRVIADRIPA